MTGPDMIRISDCTVAFLTRRGKTFFSPTVHKIDTAATHLGMGDLVPRYLQKLEFLGKQNTHHFLTSLADNFISQKAE